MPDLTTEYKWECDSVDNFSTTVQGSGGREYVVSVQTWRAHRWHCTCSSFKYKRFVEGTPYCKHIIEVQQKEYCGWMQFLAGGEPAGEPGKRTCPHCGRPATSRGWAV